MIEILSQQPEGSSLGYLFPATVTTAGGSSVLGERLTKRESRDTRGLSVNQSATSYSLPVDPAEEQSGTSSSTLDSELQKKLNQAVRRIVTLLSLPEGWDSYAASKIDRYRATVALSVLAAVMSERTPLPAIVPTCDGGMQVEWHRCGLDLEIEIAPDASTVVFFRDSRSGEVREDEVIGDTATLRSLVARLTSC